MRSGFLWRAVGCALGLLMLHGCKDEPNPRVIEVKSDPRIKRIDMSNVSGAVGVK